MNYKYLIPLIYQITCTFPALAGMIFYRRLSRGAKILAFYYVIAAIVDNITWYLFFHGYNGSVLYHFFDPIEYFCFVFAFSYWVGSRKLTKMLRYSILGFLVLSVFNSLRVSNNYHYSFDALSIAYLVYVFVSSLAIYNLIKSDTGAIQRNPVFWLAASLFTMSANNVLYYAVIERLANAAFVKAFWHIHQVANIAAFILATIGILLYRYNKVWKTKPPASGYWE